MVGECRGFKPGNCPEALWKQTHFHCFQLSGGHAKCGKSCVAVAPSHGGGGEGVRRGHDQTCARRSRGGVTGSNQTPPNKDAPTDRWRGRRPEMAAILRFTDVIILQSIKTSVKFVMVFFIFLWRFHSFVILSPSICFSFCSPVV